MGAPRQTFIVTIRDGSAPAVIENVATREQVRLAELADAGTQIARWLGSPAPAQASPVDPTIPPLQDGMEPITGRPA